MSSSFTITSSAPNNALILILSQTVDSNGEPLGAPTGLALLDDGQSFVCHPGPHAVIVAVEHPRNSATPALAQSDDPAPVPTDPTPATAAEPARPEPIPTIGAGNSAVAPPVAA